MYPSYFPSFLAINCSPYADQHTQAASKMPIAALRDDDGSLPDDDFLPDNDSLPDDYSLLDGVANFNDIRGLVVPCNY